jgi:hypothetical protein
MFHSRPSILNCFVAYTTKKRPSLSPINHRQGPRTENTILELRGADHKETSHVIAISPVHWRADCCLATSYRQSSYCCVRVSLSSRCLAIRWHATISYLSKVNFYVIIHNKPTQFFGHKFVAKYKKSASVRETNSRHESQVVQERPVI